jgi:hypothetical protein
MQLRNLPKDILLEIIVKQNQIEHLSNEQCLELIDKYKDKIKKNLAAQFREFFKIPGHIRFEKFKLKCKIYFKTISNYPAPDIVKFEINKIVISLDAFNLEKCISLEKEIRDIVVTDNTNREYLEYGYQRHWELVEGFDLILNHINKNPIDSFEFFEKLFYQMGKGKRRENWEYERELELRLSI